MIGKLTGTQLGKNPPEVLLDSHGVGYEAQVPMSTFYNLPAFGERVRQIKEKAIRRLRHASRSKQLRAYLG